MPQLNPLNESKLMQNFGSVSKFEDRMKDAKVIMSPGVDGKAYLEFKGVDGKTHHVRMKEMAKVFEELGKNIKPENSEKYASIGIKLAIEERAIKPMDKESASFLQDIGTQLRKIIDRLFGPRSNADQRMGTYKKGVEKGQQVLPKVKEWKKGEKTQTKGGPRTGPLNGERMPTGTKTQTDKNVEMLKNASSKSVLNQSGYKKGPTQQEKVVQRILDGSSEESEESETISKEKSPAKIPLTKSGYKAGPTAEEKRIQGILDGSGSDESSE